MLKQFISVIQRYGAPHEESLIIPTIFTIVMLRRSEVEGVNGERGFIYCVVAFIIFGAWLGLAWKSENAIRVGFRTYYIGILTTAGYAALTSKQHTLEEYMRFIGLIAQGLGGSYFVGWMIGSTIRQISFLTEAEKAIAKRRRMILWNFIRIKVFRSDPLLLPEIPAPAQSEAPNQSNEQNAIQSNQNTKRISRITLLRLSLPSLKNNQEKFRYAFNILWITFAVKFLVFIVLRYHGSSIYDYIDLIRGFILE